MGTFDDLIGNTEAYLRGDEVGVRLRRLRKFTGKARGLAKRAMRADPVTRRVTKLATKGLALATGPVRRRIFRGFFRKLISRRARLISWQKRRSLQPTAGEQRDARSWAAAYVRSKGVLGKLVGTALSGEVTRSADLVGEPATAAVITASIALLIQLVRRALKTAEREGAPADPQTATRDRSSEPSPESTEDD
jgi:hypothetical protein